MNPSEIIDKLSDHATVFESLTHNLSQEEYSWKSSPESWSILEIICHIRDEEVEDFRRRIKFILDGKEPPPFDPQAWVTERDYASRRLEDVMASLLREREGSVLWLHSLDSSDWKMEYDHPTRGTITTKFYLENWLAHDYLHIRQIIKVKYDYLDQLGEVPIDYAGNWK